MAQNIIKQFFVKIDNTALLCDILYMDLFFIGFFSLDSYRTQLYHANVFITVNKIDFI